MPIIDIFTMRGMIPRTEDHLLPDEAATLAQDCHFDRGVVSALTADQALGVTLPITPKTLFHYYGPHWFAWDSAVEVMRSPVAQDPYNRVYYTDGFYPKITYDQIATSASTKPSAWFKLGVPAPATPPNATAVTPPPGGVDGTVNDDETRYYVETYVTALGEEGPPSTASGKVFIPIPNSTVTVALSPAPTNNNNITMRRLYRSVSSSGAADFFLVAEIPISTTSFADNRKEGQLGALLETYGYTMPPSGMRGICQMANGICAGFVGNTVLFSEPFLPYAWPDKYKMSTEHNIVAIAAIDTALIVGTAGYPYVFQGASPSSMTGQKLSSVQQACVSARSMVALDGMVLYASPDGLVGVGGDGATLVTEQLITREQWQALRPDTIRAWQNEGRYVALTDTTGFIFDPRSGDFRWLTGRWNEAYPDMSLDALVLAKANQLYRWRGTTTKIPMRWRSKEFVMPPSTKMQTARIVSPDLNNVSITMTVDGVQVMNIPAGSVPAAAFRLPAIRGRVWQVEVSGAATVERIVIGSSMAEVASR